MSHKHLAALAARLRALHVPSRPLVLTNVHDGATASLALSHPSTTAIATASYAIALAQGTTDATLTQPENLAGIRAVTRVVARERLDIPVTADVQDGYASVSETIRMVLDLGVVGVNLEDVSSETGKLYSEDEAAARVAEAVRTAAEAGVQDFVVNARTDVLRSGGRVEDLVRRGTRFLEAGACTVFVWGGPGGRGVRDDEVREVVKELQGRVSVKMNLREGMLTVKQLGEMGVARISVGPELYHKGMKGWKDAMERMLEGGEFS